MVDLQAYTETEQFNRVLAVVEALKRAEPVPTDSSIVECYVGINSLITAYEEGEFDNIPAHFSDVLDNCDMSVELNVYLARLVLHKWKIPNPWPEGFAKFIKYMSLTLSD